MVLDCLKAEHKFGVAVVAAIYVPIKTRCFIKRNLILKKLAIIFTKHPKTGSLILQEFSELQESVIRNNMQIIESEQSL